MGVQSLSDRLAAEETLVSLESRVGNQESLQKLHAEDTEDQSRRNNLQLWGLPEATGTENLSETVATIFHKISGGAIPTPLEFNSVHRALGPRPADPGRPRDIICRLHHYTHKETILHQAWEAGVIDFDGSSVKILPDLSKVTLQHRAMLQPLLDLACRLGLTYRGGYPLSVTFRKDQRSFTLRAPADLPALFTFMEMEPISIPNWLPFIQRPV